MQGIQGECLLPAIFPNVRHLFFKGRRSCLSVVREKIKIKNFLLFLFLSCLVNSNPQPPPHPHPGWAGYSLKAIRVCADASRWGCVLKVRTDFSHFGLKG